MFITTQNGECDEKPMIILALAFVLFFCSCCGSCAEQLKRKDEPAKNSAQSKDTDTAPPTEDKGAAHNV